VFTKFAIFFEYGTEAISERKRKGSRVEN